MDPKDIPINFSLNFFFNSLFRFALQKLNSGFFRRLACVVNRVTGLEFSDSFVSGQCV